MAANDPSFGVATPRGVLQGVAVFTHDGANWQPTGRAATEVATPTGVLRGVAAFSGGPNWAPVARAQTEVPTPSGVLDGVAVYTWDGTKWTPPGGNIETATPSGVLEGVAAFDWDGANWQPASQAGAEVPTPYGVLTGVARFGWTGSAWAAVSSGPPGMTLDLNFMNPGTLDPRITFTRASTGTYFDATGTMQTAAIDTPRWETRGLLFEDASTNGVRNSTMQGAVVAGAAPTNWVVTTVAGIIVAVAGLGTENGLSYIDFSFSGTAGASGSVTVAADSTTQIAAVTGQAWAATCYIKLVSGSVVGTLSSGYSVRGAGGAFLGDYLAPVSASPAALAGQRWLQTNASGIAGIAFVQPKPIVLALTNGQVVNFTLRVAGPQLEQKDTPSSYIPTSSVAVTRAIDSCTIAPANMGWFTPPGGSWFAEFDYLDATPINNARIIARSDLISGVSPALITSANLLGQNDGVAVNSANAATANAITKAATTWAAGQAKVCVNGGAVASSTSLATGYGALTSGGIRLMSVGSGLSCEGHIRRLSYAPIVWSDAQMQQVTT